VGLIAGIKSGMSSTESKPTLKDVTELAGCSLAVASTILNNGQQSTVRYSEDLAQRVRDCAKKLGYRGRQRRVRQLEPNRGLLDLATTLPVGIIIHPYRSQVGGMESQYVEAMSRQFERFDITQQMIYANDQFHVSRLRERIRRHDLAAAVTFAMGPEDDELVNVLDMDLPVVMVNPYRIPEHNAVVPDDEQGVIQACEFLSLIGAKRVLYVGNESFHYSGPLRRAVLAQQFARLGIKLAGEFNHNNLTRQPLARLLKRSKVDTIVCYNNVMVHRAMALLGDMQIRVPDDINLLSLSGLSSDANSTAITQVVVQFDQMGRIAADLAIDMIKHKQARFENVKVPEYLRVGSTCRCV
jgi:DNA-binding LacI/PurR family transcriptional regulator